MKTKLCLYYMGGAVVWFLALAIMPADEGSTPMLLANFANLTLGTFVGIFGKEHLIKRPWLLLLLPLFSLIFEVFGIF
jgi:hypothetical protein